MAAVYNEFVNVEECYKAAHEVTTQAGKVIF